METRGRLAGTGSEQPGRRPLPSRLGRDFSLSAVAADRRVLYVRLLVSLVDAGGLGRLPQTASVRLRPRDADRGVVGDRDVAGEGGRGGDTALSRV